MESISKRFFLVQGNNSPVAVDVVISNFKAFDVDGSPMYEVRACMPGVLPDENGPTRRRSSLDALLSSVEKLRVFAKDYEKSGGKIYPCRFDDINQPWTGDGPIKAKDFLKVP